MLNEQMVLQQLFSRLSGATLVWLQVSVIALLILAPIWKSERIHSVYLFRLGGVLTAMSILIPALLDFFLLVARPLLEAGAPNPFSRTPGTSNTVNIFMQLGGTLGPLLLGTGVLCVLLAVAPRSRRHTMAQSSSAPVRPHPLDVSETPAQQQNS